MFAIAPSVSLRSTLTCCSKSIPCRIISLVDQTDLAVCRPFYLARGLVCHGRPSVHESIHYPSYPSYSDSYPHHDSAPCLDVAIENGYAVCACRLWGLLCCGLRWNLVDDQPHPTSVCYLADDCACREAPPWCKMVYLLNYFMSPTRLKLNGKVATGKCTHVTIFSQFAYDISQVSLHEASNANTPTPCSRTAGKYILSEISPIAP